MTRIGAITIGQSPREDIVSDLKRLLPAPVEIVERGALDHLSREEIQSLAPSREDFPLVTLLRDREPVVVGKKPLIPLVARAIRDLEREADLILLLCSGSFPEFPSLVPVLYPDRILEHFVRGIAPKSASVLIPHQGQVDEAKRKWGASIGQLTMAVATPYPWNGPALSGELVIMDCLGYSLAMKDEVRKKTGGRVVLVRSVAASAVRELLSD